MERTRPARNGSAKWKTAGWVFLLLVLGVGVGLAVFYLTPTDDIVNVKSDGTPVTKSVSNEVAKKGPREVVKFNAEAENKEKRSELVYGPEPRSDGYLDPEQKARRRGIYANVKAIEAKPNEDVEAKAEERVDPLLNELKEKQKELVKDNSVKPKLDTPKDVKEVLTRDVASDKAEEATNVEKTEEAPVKKEAEPTKEEVKSVLEEGAVAPDVAQKDDKPVVLTKPEEAAEAPVEPSKDNETPVATEAPLAEQKVDGVPASPEPAVGNADANQKVEEQPEGYVEPAEALVTPEAGNVAQNSEDVQSDQEGYQTADENVTEEPKKKGKKQGPPVPKKSAAAKLRKNREVPYGPEPEPVPVPAARKAAERTKGKKVKGEFVSSVAETLELKPPFQKK